MTKPHGVRGEVRVRLHWAASETLLAAASVWLHPNEQPARSVRVERARGVPKGVLLKFDGIDDRDAAEALREVAVEVDRASLPEPAEGEVYLCDLIAAQVVGPDGPVGRVIEVRPYPTVDAVVLETPDGRRLEQPLSEPWLEHVDAAEGRIVLSSLDGLIE